MKTISKHVLPRSRLITYGNAEVFLTLLKIGTQKLGDLRHNYETIMPLSLITSSESCDFPSKQLSGDYYSSKTRIPCSVRPELAVIL